MEMRWVPLLVASLCASGCGDPPPGKTYFARQILPILEQNCFGNTSGCHSPNTDDPFKFVGGNLDLSTFENIQKRRDVLTPFGPYSQPLLLIKSVAPGSLKFQYGMVPGQPTVARFLPIDVLHVGGAILSSDSDAYFTLQAWLDNGATENGLKPPTPAKEGAGECSEALPAGFVATTFTSMKPTEFETFKRDIQPILDARGCAAGSCHGAPQSDFYITCGTSEDQRAFNFSQAWSFVNDPVDDSQLLKVPLAVESGGRGHTGGDQFSGMEDPNYARIKAWAASVGKLPFASGDPVKQFFADNVQPVLLQRGCAFQACHSPQSGNDFKLRSGSPGFFSSVALQKNYDLLRDEFMALEFPDARRSRAVAKTIIENDDRTDRATNDPVGGIAHRGGPVLETQNSVAAGPEGCPQPYNANAMPPPTAYCTIQEWVRLERAALGAQVSAIGTGETAQVVYVQRAAAAPAGRLEFDTFQGGADLRISDAPYTAEGGLGTADGGTSLIGGCNLGASPDVQAPDVANDGNRIAFAARSNATSALGIYVVDIAGNNCTRITPDAGMVNGMLVHNFDPAWTPDGQSIVFASTRGKNGPTRSRKRFLPQSDIWRVGVNGFAAAGTPEQMTVLSNSEIGPAFMREGRMTMTTEKVSDGFYQLAGRRINWDLTDYHPLLGQRKDSPFGDGTAAGPELPSIGYSSVTDIRESSDGNFLIILGNTADNGTPSSMGGAGALGIFNRSIGPFEKDRVDKGFLASLKVVDAAEVYRNPVPLPDGRIMVSKASSPTAANFDVVMVNPRDGSQQNLFGAGAIRVDAQLVYKYPARHLYDNRRQLVFGGNADGDPADAVLHIPDAPMLFTLLLGNLRRGRPLDDYRRARFLAVYREEPCPNGPCSANVGGVYQQRSPVGTVPLAEDGSVKVRLPAQIGLIFELQDGDRRPVVTMTEEHQLGPGENISMGVSASLFDAVCGGCHGSISGEETDVIVTPDALTNASASLSADRSPASP